MKIRMLPVCLSMVLVLGGTWSAAWADKEKEDGQRGKSSHSQSYGKGHGPRHGGVYGHGSMRRGAGAGHFIRGLLKYGQGFGLTEDQIQKLKTIKLEMDRTRIKTEADIMVAEKELEALLDDEKADLATIEAKVKESEMKEVQLRMVFIKAKRDAQAILTPEQREKVKAVHERMKQQGMKKKGQGRHSKDGKKEAKEEEEEAKENAEKAELSKGAKVTIDQAIKAASGQVSGTVIEAELEKEDGKAVWEVEVVKADGQVVELQVDAMTGAVTAEDGDTPKAKK